MTTTIYHFYCVHAKYEASMRKHNPSKTTNLVFFYILVFVQKNQKNKQ